MAIRSPRTPPRLALPLALGALLPALVLQGRGGNRVCEEQGGIAEHLLRAGATGAEATARGAAGAGPEVQPAAA